MNIRERIERLGRELLTLGGLLSDVEERIVLAKKEYEKLMAEVEAAENEHY